MSICVAFNTQGTQGLGEGDGFALLDILQKMEWEPPMSAFPDHDLFDDL